MFQRNSLAVLGLVGLAAVGCSESTTSSDNIKTGGIVALIDVNAESDTTATVHVALKVGDAGSTTYVTLDNGDKLVATAADQTKTLTSVGNGTYEASFTGVEAETPFTVSLERPNDTTAPGNSGTLPPPFTVDKPTAGLSRKDEDLEITWAPADSGDGMDLDFTGSCIFKLSKSPADTGSYTVTKGSLDSTGGDMPENCDVSLAIQRSRAGEVDTAFDADSWFRLHQLRSTKFASEP